MSTTDLRKKALSGSVAESSHLQTPSPSQNINSATSSGATTPTRMFKTDSVINLTKPSLYGIYNDNDNSLLNLSKDELDGMYVTPPTSKHLSEDADAYDEDVAAKLAARRASISKVDVGSPAPLTNADGLLHTVQSNIVLKTAVNTVILTFACFVYNEITKNIHNTHLEQLNAISQQPLSLAHTVLGKLIRNLRSSLASETTPSAAGDWILSLVIQGFAMGSIHPIMDKILPSALSKRLLSSAPQSARSASNSPNSAAAAALNSSTIGLGNDLLRSLITFLGLSYAVRKVEWTSALQVSLLWSSLNPCLWLLLDGTISGFIASTVGALVACSFVYIQSYDLISLQNHQDNDFIAVWLLIASFFFCGLIIFGKLGRALW